MSINNDAYLQNLKAQQTEEEVVLSEQSFQINGNVEEAYKKIIKLAAVKERSVSDIRKCLKGASFSEDAIDEAIERACTCTLLDDLRFAESFVRTRVAAGVGRRGIEAELIRRNIEVTALEKCFEDCFASEDDEVERALVLLNKKPPRAKNKREAAYRKLIGKGYSSSIATTAVRLWSEAL